MKKGTQTIKEAKMNVKESEVEDIEMDELEEEVEIEEPRKTDASAKNAAKQFSNGAVRIGEGFGKVTHKALIVTERVIGKLIDAYQNTFVVDDKLEAGYFKDQGYVFFDKGDFERAIEKFLLFLDENEPDAEMLYYLSLAYCNLEEYENATKHLKKAEQLEKEDSDILHELGSCLVKTQKYKEAVSYLKRAIKLVPDEASNYYLLGTVYEKTNMLKESIETYKKTIDIDPKDPLYYHALGFAFESNGQHKDAIACFKKAMELERSR